MRKLKAGDFRLKRVVKVYSKEGRNYFIEVRAEKRKDGYNLFVGSAGSVVYCNFTYYNTKLDHINRLVNSLIAIDERRTRLDKVVFYNEVLEPYSRVDVVRGYDI